MDLAYFVSGHEIIGETDRDITLCGDRLNYSVRNDILYCNKFYVATTFPQLSIRSFKEKNIRVLSPRLDECGHTYPDDVEMGGVNKMYDPKNYIEPTYIIVNGKFVLNDNCTIPNDYDSNGDGSNSYTSGIGNTNPELEEFDRISRENESRRNELKRSGASNITAENIEAYFEDVSNLPDGINNVEFYRQLETLRTKVAQVYYDYSGPVPVDMKAFMKNIFTKYSEFYVRDTELSANEYVRNAYKQIETQLTADDDDDLLMA